MLLDAVVPKGLPWNGVLVSPVGVPFAGGWGGAPPKIWFVCVLLVFFVAWSVCGFVFVFCEQGPLWGRRAVEGRLERACAILGIIFWGLVLITYGGGGGATVRAFWWLEAELGTRGRWGGEGGRR